MKTIFVHNRLIFLETMTNTGFLADPEAHPNTASISIYGSFEDPVFTQEHTNVLSLQFDDISDVEAARSVHNKLNLFSEIDIDKIYAFAKCNQHADTWFVHCSAGQSRSGAVGLFLCDYFDVPYQEYMQTNPQVIPNMYVYTKLKAKLWNAQLRSS